MATYHWLRGSFDAGFLAGFGVRNIDINIPATATLHRMMTRGVKVEARSSGAGIQWITELSMTVTVDIIAGQYAGRNIFRTTRDIPFEATALYDFATLERIYTAYYHAGDRELNLNQRVSYGTATGPGFTIRCQTSVINAAGSLGIPDGRFTAEFACLYSI